MAINIQNLVPAYATHPGEVLKDELDARGISQSDFAKQIGIAASQLNEILKGKRNLNAELAVLFEHALGIEANIWMRLQSSYEIDLIRIDKRVKSKIEINEKWNKLKSIVPLKYFKKRQILINEIESDLNTILKIYKANDVDDINNMVSEPKTAYFRKSGKFKSDSVNETAWVKLVKYQSIKQTVPPFDIKKMNLIVEQIKTISLQENIIAKTEKLLKENGIKFVNIEKPDHVPVDGYVFWSEDNPAIAITQRYKRIDNFIFTVMHELGHIALHLTKDKTKEFLDDVEDMEFLNVNKEEREADNFATQNLIPENKWHKFAFEVYPHNDENIINFANELHIHPSIVRGRLCRQFPFNYKKRTSINNKLEN